VAEQISLSVQEYLKAETAQRILVLMDTHFEIYLQNFQQRQ